MRSPHRGPFLLALAVIGVLLFAPLGPVSWWWAQRDLDAMAAGRMDKAGEPATALARFLSALATLMLGLMLVGISISLFSILSNS